MLLSILSPACPRPTNIKVPSETPLKDARPFKGARGVAWREDGGTYSFWSEGGCRWRQSASRWPSWCPTARPGALPCLWPGEPPGIRLGSLGPCQVPRCGGCLVGGAPSGSSWFRSDNVSLDISINVCQIHTFSTEHAFKRVTPGHICPLISKCSFPLWTYGR